MITDEIDIEREMSKIAHSLTRREIGLTELMHTHKAHTTKRVSGKDLESRKEAQSMADPRTPWTETVEARRGLDGALRVTTAGGPDLGAILAHCAAVLEEHAGEAGADIGDLPKDDHAYVELLVKAMTGAPGSCASSFRSNSSLAAARAASSLDERAETVALRRELCIQEEICARLAARAGGPGARRADRSELAELEGAVSGARATNRRRLHSLALEQKYAAAEQAALGREEWELAAARRCAALGEMTELVGAEAAAAVGRARARLERVERELSAAYALFRSPDGLAVLAQAAQERQGQEATFLHKLHQHIVHDM